MNIINARREVDTICVEMDVSTAEKLAEILSYVYQDGYSYDLTELRDVIVSAGVRSPSPLYNAEVDWNVIGIYPKRG